MLMKVNTEHEAGEDGAGHDEDRPIIFALSNPKSQAEVTAADAYAWSGGKVIYGSGTQFGPVEIAGRTHAPGQVSSACHHGLCTP
jgi:malic enzyme